MTDFIQVTTTIAERTDADRIAAALLERRLAACVQIGGPITSHYWWQGKRRATQEWTVTAKTHRRLYERVERAVRELHPYEVPEILAVPVVAGSASYLQWLADELEPPSE